MGSCFSQRNKQGVVAINLSRLPAGCVSSRHGLFAMANLPLPVIGSNGNHSHFKEADSVLGHEPNMRRQLPLFQPSWVPPSNDPTTGQAAALADPSNVEYPPQCQKSAGAEQCRDCKSEYYPRGNLPKTEIPQMFAHFPNASIP